MKYGLVVGGGLVGMEGWGDGEVVEGGLLVWKGGEVVGGGLVGMEGWGNGEVVGGGLVGMEGWGDGEVVREEHSKPVHIHVEGVEMWVVKEALGLPDKGVVGVAGLGVEGGAELKRVGVQGWGGCRPFMKGVIGWVGASRTGSIGNWME